MRGRRRGPRRVLPAVQFRGLCRVGGQPAPCLIGMEACSSAHHWARFLTQHGHTPRLMAAELVEPYRLSRGAKNDRNDAQAILSAVRQPNMRFVTVKSIDQQAMLAWHRARAGVPGGAQGAAQSYARPAGRVRPLARALSRPCCGDSCRAWLRMSGCPRGSGRSSRTSSSICGRSMSASMNAMCRSANTPATVSTPSGCRPSSASVTITASALIATIANPRDFRNGRQPIGLVWPRAPPAQLRRQSTPRCHHQTRRCLPARPAHPGRTLHPASRPQTRARCAAPGSNTGSSRCTIASAITRRWWRSPTSTCAPSGPSSPTTRTTIPTPGAAIHARRAAPELIPPRRRDARSTTRSDRVR